MERVNIHEKGKEEAYWSSFYEKANFERGSSFCELMGELPNLPGTVIDIGCGQGRDSFAFAGIEGVNVIGLDRSDVGVATANAVAAENNLDEKLEFYSCDVSDSERVAELFDHGRARSATGDVCYYMRFFLHSIPEDIQDSLMGTIAQHARPGDVFSAEFRTDKDEFNAKEFGNSHYRRYQNADEFAQTLRDKYGWTNVVYEVESDGLAPYGDEDPVLYRVIAVR